MHAALAANVAAWDTYVKALVEAFFSVVGSIGGGPFLSHHVRILELMRIAKAKLNTPNAENVRTFLVQYTGYDPISDWVWVPRRMTGLDTRERLNEILKVRHSFAHGHAMPRYVWNVGANGEPRLTGGILAETGAFFDYLVGRTDYGCSAFVRDEYGVDSGWY